jgi:hypothetical protein
MDFINILYDTLIYKKNIILVGDFYHNILTSNRKKSITKQWIDFFKNISLQEFHFNEKINESSCTWSNEISSTRIDRIYYSKDLKEKFDFKYNNLLVNIFSDHKIVIADIIFKNVTNNNKTKINYDNWKLNDSILDDEVVIFKMKAICEEIVEYFDEINPSWYDYFINKARRLLIFESIRIKKKNEKYIDEISQELQEWYEEGENNKNEETELRIDFLKNKINKYYESKKKGIEKRNKKFLKILRIYHQKRYSKKVSKLTRKPELMN